MIKQLKYIVIVFFSCVILQIAAYCIPADAIMNNVIDSSWTLREGGIYTLAPEYYSLRIDTFTDAWMLDIASWAGNESILEKAFGSYYYDFSEIASESGTGPWLALNELSAGNNNLPRGSYARYWHGYVFFLKVALIFMNYSDIRVFNFFILLFLTLYLFYTLAQEKKEIYAPFAIFIMVLCPLSAFFCMAYTGVILLSLLSSILLIKFKWWNNELVGKKYMGTFFTIVGMLTAWLDLLSFPLITLCTPLIFFICYAENDSFKGAVLDVVFLSLCWGTGYAGMWCAKWCLSSIVLDVNVFSDALGAARVRSSAKAGDLITNISLIDVMAETWGVIGKIPYVILGVIGIVYLGVKHRINNLRISNKKKAIQLLIVAFYPVVWCAFMKNHTYGHCLFTFRIWGVSLFAISSILYACTSGLKRDKFIKYGGEDVSI